MAKKFLLPTILVGVTIGLGTTLFSLWSDEIDPPAPSQTQYHAMPPRDRTGQREQGAQSQVKSSKESRTPPQETTVIGAPSRPPRLPESLYVEARNGLVTLRAEHHSLKEVLAMLAQESGVQINTDLISDRPLSLALVGVPLERALSAILQFEDSFFAFESRSQPQAA